MGIELNKITKQLTTKCKEYFSIDSEKKHSISDRSALYKEQKSFSDFMPYSEWLDDEDMILMDDLTSVGCGWEVVMSPSEARSISVLDDIEEAIYDALDSITLKYLVEGQYVLSSYLRDDFDLGTDMREIEESIHPKWKGTPLAEAYIDSMAKMFKGLESESGLFMDGGDTGARPFRGGKRIPRMFLYRRVPLKDRKADRKKRDHEIEELKQIRSSLEESLRSLGVRLERIKRESFYEFMVRWFNPNPSSTNGSINALLKANPCPSQEISAIDGEFAMSFLFNTPKTDKEKGVIEFDGCPSRYLQVDRIIKPPKTALLTAEREGRNDGEYVANFDSLPSGTMFVKSIYFQMTDETEARVRFVESQSRFTDDKAELVNEEAKNTLSAMARGNRLYKTEMGFYVTALTQERLEDKSRKIMAHATQRLGLGVIDPKNNLFPIESYLRNLPLSPDPMLDKRRRRGRQSWLHHSVSMLPMIGRKRGNEAQADKRCMTAFNRGGEVINIDPLNRESNAHMVLLGPTGTGKSATLNKLIVELLIFHNARLVIAEAGMSFDPLMDFLEAQDADVQRVNINSGKQGKPIAPFANARKAREKLIQDKAKTGMSEEDIITEIVSQLEDIDGDCEQRISDRVAEAVSENTDTQELEKDYLGECVMIGKIMVTGGDAKEEEAWRLRDRSHLAAAILAAVGIADSKNEDLVRPEHLEEALRVRAENQALRIDDGMRARISEMADNISNYTSPGDVRSDVLNRKAEPFKKCDCLHVELGIAQRGGYEDVLALAYLGLLNNINDIAERKELEGDDRPIYVVTDEAHLILKHKMISPVAIKIVRMWRKYGAWFLPATQDTTSFTDGAEAILVIGEMFLCLSPPEDEIETLTKLLSLSVEQQAMIRTAKMAKKKYTEGVYFNRQRKTATLFRLLQPSFCLSIAGSEDAEKRSRRDTMNKYGIRMAGAVLIEAAKLDFYRGIITKEECEQISSKVANDSRYQAAA